MPVVWLEEASLDLFDIFTGAEAAAYAASHGLAVPGNGILYVNESEAPESVPLADGAVIGVLNIESPQLNGFDDQARRILGNYASNAALAIRQAPGANRHMP